MPELITLEEVAQYLRVTEKTIYRLLEQSKIPATKVGRLWRFDRAGIDDWLKRRSVGLKPKILVVDDEETVQLLFKEALGSLGHEVATVGSGEEGLEQAKQ